MKLKQGDIRYVTMPGICENIPVKICGIASEGITLLGVGYIVEILEPFQDIKIYPYTYMVIYERYLK